MTDLAPEASSALLWFLRTAAVGDIVQARACATDLMMEAGSLPADCLAIRLGLTAALLQLQAAADPPRHLQVLLDQLSHRPVDYFMESAMAFVQFAGLELADLDLIGCTKIMATCAEALRSSAPFAS